ncbi:hypothetical protein ACLOJK_034268, partial [Asimina triloba]
MVSITAHQQKLHQAARRDEQRTHLNQEPAASSIFNKQHGQRVRPQINIKRGVAHSSNNPADLGSSPLFQRPTSNQEIQISQQWWQQNPTHGDSKLKTQIAWLIPIPRNARAHKISAQPMQTSENPTA